MTDQKLLNLSISICCKINMHFSEFYDFNFFDSLELINKIIFVFYNV